MAPHFVFTSCPTGGFVNDVIQYGCVDMSGTANDDIIAFSTIRDPGGRVFTVTMPTVTPHPMTFGHKVYLSGPGRFEIEITICEKSQPGLPLTVHANLSLSIGSYWL